MPITNKRILITRSRQQASELAERLEDAGAQTILIPTIELAPPTSFAALDNAIAVLETFDWLLFTSANAVQAFAERAGTARPKRIAAIGPATAKAAQSCGLTVDLVPPRYVAESLAEALLPHAANANILLIRAEQARDILPEALTSAGAKLTIADAYRTIVPPSSIAALQQLFASPDELPDAITFTSSSTATNLFALLEAAALTLPPEILRASIGPITSQTLRDLAHPPHIEADESTIPSLCRVLAQHFR